MASTLRALAEDIALEIEAASLSGGNASVYAEKVRYGMSLALLHAHSLTVLQFRYLRKRQDGSCAVVDELAKLIKAELHELEKQGS